MQSTKLPEALLFSTKEQDNPHVLVHISRVLSPCSSHFSCNLPSVKEEMAEGLLPAHHSRGNAAGCISKYSDAEQLLWALFPSVPQGRALIGITTRIASAIALVLITMASRTISFQESFHFVLYCCCCFLYFCCC